MGILLGLRWSWYEGYSLDSLSIRHWTGPMAEQKAHDETAFRWVGVTGAQDLGVRVRVRVPSWATGTGTCVSRIRGGFRD